MNINSKIPFFSPENYKSRLLIALFFHSLSIISFQIILMRILSVIQWDHFANMIISIAMLGFGVSGTILALINKRLINHSEKLIPFLMALSSVLMLLAYRVSQYEFVIFDTFLVFSSTDQLLRLVLFLFLYFLPFFTASLAIGLIYVKYVSGIGKLYFSNLLGSGIGGTIGLVLLLFFLPQNALFIACIFPVIAALIIFPSNNKLFVLPIFAIFVFLGIYNISNPVSPRLSQYKSLSQTLLLPDAEVSITKSGISSQVEIVESAYLRYAPGLSLHFIGRVPVKPMAFVNGNAAGFIPEYRPGQTEDILKYSAYNLPYIVADHNTVAVIKSGTGTFVAHALRSNSKNVYAIEPEISLINALEKWHQNNFPSVYDCEKVSLHNIEARAFFNNTREKFDLIILPSIGSFGGTSGLMAIHEDFSVTVEALETYWEKLKKDGSISLTVYTDFPPRGTLKATASLVKMLCNYGISEPKDHIVAIRSWTAITYMVRKKAFNADEIQKIREFCNQMGFDPFILPDIKKEERTYFNHIEDKEIFVLTDNILENKNTDLQKNYLFYIAPATDDKPYFSRYIKISKINELLKQYPRQEIPFIELGYIIVWLTFIFAIIFSIILIIIPVCWFKRGSGKLPVLIYFGAIGLGFMFAEIILIQRFVLYLGQPVYAVTAVLSVMLLVSGIGSYFSSKVNPGTKFFNAVYLMIALILLVYALFLTSFLSLTAGYNMAIRIIITCIIVGLPAFFMGMPFPLGLKTLSKTHDDKIAWAWGINGFFSVIATPMALIIAIETGSTIVISIAAGVYIFAFAAIKYFKSRK